MKVVILSLIILLILNTINSQENPFTWTDPTSGTKYDFSSLKKSPE